MKAYSETRTVKDELYSRLVRIFENKIPVLFSFSGGKDSLVIAHALEILLTQGKIDKKLLTVLFVDEEGIYPCLEESVLRWRKKFMVCGVKFVWFCLEIKHFNCFNTLIDEEGFICWDRDKKENWIREKPKFAVSTHPAFRRGMTYQDFMTKMDNCIQIIGVRASESVQRLSNFQNSGGCTKIGTQYNYFPIYDWALNDIFLYLSEYNVQIPDAYMYMWITGIPVNKLRISQFFSIDTAQSLVQMMEFYPELYEKIIKREPNAVLAMNYFHTAMFRRNSKKRKDLEGVKEEDWRAKFWELVSDEEYAHRPETKRAKRIAIVLGMQMANNDWRALHGAVYTGDPKGRTLRAVYSTVGAGNLKRSTL